MACGEVNDAVQLGDYATAWMKLFEAESINAALEAVSEFHGHRIERRESLDKLTALLERMETRAKTKRDRNRIMTTQVIGGRG